MTASGLDIILKPRTAQGANMIKQITTIESAVSASLLSRGGEITF